MSLPIFPAKTPEVIPAKSYDKIWIKEIVVSAPDPNGEVNGEVKLSKYGMFDGVAETQPDNLDQWLRVSNMLEASLTDEDLALALQALLGYVYKLGIMEGVIANPNPTTTPEATTPAPTTTPEATTAAPTTTLAP